MRKNRTIKYVKRVYNRCNFQFGCYSCPYSHYNKSLKGFTETCGGVFHSLTSVLVPEYIDYNVFMKDKVIKRLSNKIGEEVSKGDLFNED